MQGGQRWKKNSLNKEKRVGRSTLPLAKQNVIYFKTYENRILYKSYAGRSETQKKLNPLLPVSMYKRDGQSIAEIFFIVFFTDSKKGRKRRGAYSLYYHYHNMP